MRRGHVTGHKREKKGSQDWYAARQEELLRQIEATWQAPAPQQQAPATTGAAQREAA